MTKALYVAALESHSGKSLLVLGLMQLLLGKMAKVGYFRPVIGDLKKGEVDNHINTVISHFDLDIAVEDAYALTQSQVVDMFNDGRKGDILDKIISKYKKLEEQFDFILVEGSDFTSDGSVIEFDLNLDIAKNLGIPVILIDNARGKSLEEFFGNLESAVNTYIQKGIELLGVVANKLRPENMDFVNKRLKKELKDKTVIFTVPRVKNLSHPTIKEIVEHLNGEVLFGGESLNNQTGSFGVGAMQLHNYLKHLRDNSLVITPGDRSDIILGALQANLSDNYPTISGIVLTGGILPEPSILKLLEGFETHVPIISVKQGTFDTTNAVGNIKSKIYAESKQKIATSIALFNTHIDGELLLERLETFEPKSTTPRMFQYNLVQRAKTVKKHIVLPEGEDARIIEAASELSELGIVDITLLGNQEQIEKKAMQLGFDISHLNILDPATAPNFERYAATFCELRKHKGVNMDVARDTMLDVSYFGTMMVYKGDADGMVSGAVHTTQHTIRPALQFVKTKPGIGVVSSVFFMCLENRVSVFGDCAINPNPTAEQLAEIAISSAASAEAFGIKAKIAMLSYSSGSSGKGDDVDKVRKATEIVKNTHPHLQIEGPIQYDAAVDPLVGKSKLPDSEVAGQASVLIFPDLNTGNNTYKAVQRETGALAIGPMLQGLNKPVNDLSRGCTVEDVFNTVVVTAIQAQES
ncbi:phosphate acetyltransferase [Cellulophaga sp. HaHaR_3_176]|uniref:phosphate acetyltransferase n=1 Tax=Cellulophaga sp. HaHaR_3_176 TaxID=1942464 RepID=UPI001C2006C4|nr:phosphate acetyltransferase [Cellulophaga sp. HaHaR_3_176]QWX83897.1 phosphate acetyltransferase [Cellulophaga sp. HaHaR_3_176]